MDGIRQGLAQQPEITFNGRTLTVAETPILTEPMEQYQMAGTKGYVLVLPDEAASQFVGEKNPSGDETGRWRIPGIEKRLEAIPEQWEMAAGIAVRSTAPGKKVTMGVTVKAWGVANSLTGFTAISFCGLYLSIIFIILSCSVLAFEQLSAIDKNQKNYAVIDRFGCTGPQAGFPDPQGTVHSLLIPLLFPFC